MGDIAQRGNRLTAAKGGRIGKFGGGRTNLLEELGRVEAEPSNRNRRAEISRVHGELNRGYKTGGRVGFKFGGISGLKGVVKRFQERKEKKRLSTEERKLRPTGLGAAEGGRIGFKHGNGVEHGRPVYKGRPGKERVKKAEGGRIGLKKGGSDKKWMQKVSASIKKRGTKGKCTPITKPGCTGRAKALAKTFKKIAAKRKKA
jgi:hypothetical protein